MTELATQRPEVPPWTLGWRLLRALAWAGLTAEQMADELGIHRTTVSRWTHDRGRPTKGYLKLWALRCGVPYEWLVSGEGLPRLDSNQQPAGCANDPAISTAELAGFLKHVNIPAAALAAATGRNTS
jgi:transcriptional regulator with XRE-family HTH domain